MLSNKPARITAVATGLTSEAWRVRDEAQTVLTQLFGIENTVARNIGYRYLCRGSEEIALITLEPEQIFCKLG